MKLFMIFCMFFFFFNQNAHATSRLTLFDSLWEKALNKLLTQSEINNLNYSIKGLNGHHLGYGFNLVTELPTRSRCLINQSYQRIDNSSRYVEGRVVSTKSEVQEFFSSALSVDAEGRYGSFSASSHFQRDVSNSFQNLEKNNTVAFVVQDKTYTLINEAWPTMDPRALALLKANTDVSKTNFRNICGDALVDGIQYGRELYLLLQVKSKNQQKKDTSDIAADISASYMMLMSGSVDIELLERYRQYQQDYEIKIKAYVSGEPIVLSDTNLLNFTEKLREFEERKTNNNRIINYKTSPYQIPEGMEYWQAFKDYRAARLTIKKWDHFMAFTHSEQCQYKDVIQECALTEKMYRETWENCSNTYQWSSCFAPDDSECQLYTEQPCNYINQLAEVTWQNSVADWKQSYEVMFPKESLEINIIGYELTYERISRDLNSTEFEFRIRLDKPSQLNGHFMCDLVVKEDRISMCEVSNDWGVGQVVIEQLSYLIRQ
ncbi:hypothetical protein BCV27_18150 [Vibrio lentus]|uniref:Uncharacterized protein n=2 Tax=Vibrio lentus TaxID=136468 RepID=A0A2N7BPW9_9VIBR|nr:hypothetical protein BCV34_13560 [Vibrio lentus]PME60870.1 hypothetical protein BCV30_12575 [Vibrio lentus]PME78196.1 hypothetical protein BCV27_18150 [Vibrio lentus]PMG64946.1 hypothetical protein BCU86_01370 [Vibrio lentus]PMH90342.1 hypothetical protein BCU56_17520 [Vibrio lentus]